MRKKVEKKFRKSLEKLKEKLKKVEEEKNEKNEKKNLKKNWKNFNFFQFFFSPHYPDQMSEGYQVSKVTLCVKILKWHSISKGRYRAARAAKNPTSAMVWGNFLICRPY